MKLTKSMLPLILLSFFFFNCKEKTTENISTNPKINIPTKATVDTIGNDIIDIAKTHIGKPYLAHTLDKGTFEELTVRMDGFDCTTLVETVIGQVKAGDSYENHVQLTRYRDGIITDFASRVHYFTEWIFENQKNGRVKDVTADFKCAKPFKVKIDFMTKHRNLYPQMKPDSIFKKIDLMEKTINNYTWNYIPKTNLPTCEKSIEHGDLIAITSNVPGLDIAHLGFAYRKGKTLHLLHASTDEKEVVITSKTLHQYLMSNKKQNGIMVLKVL